MSQHNAIDFAVQQFLNHRRGRVIGEMSMTRLNSLFDRPRPMRIALQKFFVVIGFNHQRVHLAQAFDDHFCCVTEIGYEPKTAGARVKREADGIDRVMWNGKGLDVDVANRELRAGTKDSPVPMLIQRATGSHRFGGRRVCVDRNVKFPAENFEPANVVAVFVGEEHAIELFGQYPALLQAKHDLTRAQSAIDQNFAMIGRDESTVAGTAAAEQGQTEHAGI
jgi:hypothetical protein